MYLFKNNERVFCPEYSNNLLLLTSNIDSDNNVCEAYPFQIRDIDTYTREGKRIRDAVNPSIFPESMYEKLKQTYPDLINELPSESIYNEVYNTLLSILPGVLCACSDISIEQALAGAIRVHTDNKNWNYYIPINPYSLKPCKTVEEYLNTVGDSE